MQDRSPPPRQAYYAEGETWAGDVQAGLRRSRLAAWIIAGAAALIAVLEAVALVVMMPLKTVQPYTILVDRQTGYVQTAQGVQAGTLSQDASLTQSCLVQYVLARETYDATDLKDAYHKVMLWSVGAARDDYGHGLDGANPQSPQRAYPAATVLKTTVKSVSILDAHSALVRFEVQRLDGALPAGAPKPYVAAIAFRYVGTPLKVEDRFLNPLGFQVTRYRRDSEVADSAPAPRLQP